MPEPGEQPSHDRPPHGRSARRGPVGAAPPHRSLGRATLLALAAGLATAVAWAVARVILELGPGSLVIAGIGGWAIGSLMRQALGPPLLAAALGGLAWLAGLTLTWLLAMAVLPGSMRTFAERVGATPFLDWLAPQLGLLEAAALLVLAGLAAWMARPAARRAG